MTEQAWEAKDLPSRLGMNPMTALLFALWTEGYAREDGIGRNRSIHAAFLRDFLHFVVRYSR